MHIGLIGFGSIGKEVHARLAKDRAFSFSVLRRSPVQDAPSGLTQVDSLEHLLADSPDIVVECAGHQVIRDYAAKVLNAGTPMLIASIGALADADLERKIMSAATANGARVILPSGAIGGLDVLRAVAAGGDVEVHYEGVKPPAAWKGSPADDLIDLDSLTSAHTFYRGTGRETALRFPKNANVVAALALAGAGFDTMQATLTADPDAPGNTHSYKVVSPACSYEMRIENAPSAGNSRTSLLTVLSIVQEIRHFADTR